MMAHTLPRTMFVFPGQGSQYVGMGSDLYREFASARAIYARASECLGMDVAALSFEGPETELNGTEGTQIALLTHSIACLEVLREMTGGSLAPYATAGHSLGEYSALVAAGALSFEDALRLIRMRGRLMAQFGRGQMAALRLDLAAIKPLADARYCGIGGCNLPDQTVVCGFEPDLEALMADVVAHYGQGCAGRLLKTEGAFHTYLMINAAEHYRPELDATPFAAPAVKVLSNYTGQYHADDPERIRAALFFQMFHAVRWMDGLRHAFDDGVRLVVEFGGGIGRDRPGIVATPAGRKPNLEGITRKAFGLVGQRGIYLPAINLETLERAARAVRVLERATGNAADEPPWRGARRYVLYLPMHETVADEATIELGILVEELGLATAVGVVGETEESSLAFLQQCCDKRTVHAEPYLEVLVDGSTGAFLHYRGEEIHRELAALKAQLTPCRAVTA